MRQGWFPGRRAKSQVEVGSRSAGIGSLLFMGSAAAKRRPGVKAVHGVFFDDERAVVSFDVLVDFTVRDRAALRDAILADLAPCFPGRTLSLNFDTDYSD